MHPSRLLGLAAVLARGVCAGTIESSKGSARLTPAPRRNVRLGRCLRVRKLMDSFDQGCVAVSSVAGCLERNSRHPAGRRLLPLNGIAERATEILILDHHLVTVPELHSFARGEKSLAEEMNVGVARLPIVGGFKMIRFYRSQCEQQRGARAGDHLLPYFAALSYHSYTSFDIREVGVQR